MPAAGVGLAAASLLAALLLSGLCARARCQPETDPDFSLCRRSFYRETPPQGAGEAASGAGELLQRCHTLPGGRRFASLHHPTCGASVYSAFCLSQDNNWGGPAADAQAEDAGDGSRAEGAPDSEVLVPALLGGGADAGEGTAGDAAHSAWDALVSRLVRDAVVPKCAADAEGADLFVLTGAAGLTEGEDAGGCQVDALWSAVCCASGGEEGGAFSVGVVRGSGEEERVVSAQELAEVIGVAAVFTGLCGEVDSDSEVVELLLEALDSVRKEAESEAAASASAEAGPAGSVSEAGDAGSDDVPEVTQEEVMSSGQSEAQGSAVPSGDAVKLQETLEAENETQSSGSLVGGALMYLLSSSVSLLCAPVRPVVSTLTALPGQVTYVLGEDLAALSAVPCGAAALVQNMVGDAWAGVSTAVGLVTGVGELCFSGVYSCSSPLVGSLYGACYDGVAGVGQLAKDSVGIFGGTLDNAWSVSKFFGGTAWDHGGGYVGTVVSELGHQVKTVGLGVGKLVWRVGRGLGNMVGIAGGLAGGTVGSVIENVKEAFGGE
ncbi:uncharacterized protein LOC134083268 [Sardina pilchardus]|uniref:uncharacterized protein LOC134083268 n=1 Tax=Sardina pilchardus TaxID=27697 RepID=UPI002E137A8D